MIDAMELLDEVHLRSTALLEDGILLLEAVVALLKDGITFNSSSHKPLCNPCLGHVWEFSSSDFSVLQYQRLYRVVSRDERR